MPGRWEPVARKLIERYKLTNDSKILDVGCGKAFLLFEIKKILPEIKVVGFERRYRRNCLAEKAIRQRLLGDSHYYQNLEKRSDYYLLHPLGHGV